jgi:putative transposase
VRRACELAGVSRRWLGYLSRRGEDPVLGRLKELAMKHPRYGYRRLWALLRRAGQVVNLKRVRRLCVLYGLKLSRKIRRKRRGIGQGLPCRAEYPNHVWAYDFVHDVCQDGRKLKILTVQDEYTRLALAVEVARRMPASGVWAVLQRLFAEHGAPAYVRSDNGPEFIARALMRGLSSAGVACRHIDPGSPWQNGIDERFNGSLRDECLNLETFHHPDQARAVCRLYRREYNQRRPHSSLGYLTPREFASRCQGRRWPEGRPGAPPQTPKFSALGTSGQQTRRAGASGLRLVTVWSSTRRSGCSSAEPYPPRGQE